MLLALLRSVLCLPPECKATVLPVGLEDAPGDGAAGIVAAQLSHGATIVIIIGGEAFREGLQTS